jgi:predicted HicB family RNase H-like nuclease
MTIKLKTEKQIKIKRLILDVPEEFHKKVKNKANNLGISLKTYVMRAIINEEKKII